MKLYAIKNKETNELQQFNFSRGQYHQINNSNVYIRFNIEPSDNNPRLYDKLRTIKSQLTKIKDCLYKIYKDEEICNKYVIVELEFREVREI
jgi:hypothetical protein